ncbi:MAG: hypothetical protein D6798_18865 [Deltaproteobacteria bacterium]|nr:MAG: hypothetical protein D6798_18865 [Deltaproteobacteria bacterium]
MSRPTPPPDDGEEDLLDEGAAPPRRRPAPQPGGDEELFLDEPASVPPPEEELVDEDGWPDDPDLHRLPALPWDDCDEDDLPTEPTPPATGAGNGVDGGTRVDEATRDDGWLDEDGLEADDEQDLEPAPPVGGDGPTAARLVAGRILAGHEEIAVLVDFGGARLPAELATAMAESALSVPLRRRADGSVEFSLDGATHRVDGRTLRTRVRLGPHTLTIRLRLVEGAVARLVLGRSALAGRFIVDPDARRLLDVPTGEER